MAIDNSVTLSPLPLSCAPTYNGELRWPTSDILQLIPNPLWPVLEVDRRQPKFRHGVHIADVPLWAQAACFNRLSNRGEGMIRGEIGEGGEHISVTPYWRC